VKSETQTAQKKGTSPAYFYFNNLKNSSLFMPAWRIIETDAISFPGVPLSML